LVHQDLKPANVLLYTGKAGIPEAWIADLGVTDDISELAKDARRVGGTPSYMAPEQLQGRPQEVGPWTDIYAIGIMLYEALSGTRPHKGDGRKELLDARLNPPPSLEPRPGLFLPQVLLELVQNLLDPEPRQRYDRAADVRRILRQSRHALLRGSSGTGITSRGPMVATETHSTIPVAHQVFEQATRAGVGMRLRWNQVPPDAIPVSPPPEAGRGAMARASLPLFALRDIPLIARERSRQLLWQAAREVVTLQKPRVVLVVGESGAGKSRLVDSVARPLEEGGYMEVVRLRYHDPAGIDDGYIGAVRDLLAPWNDTRLDLQGRLARWLARDQGTALTEVLQDAGTLSRWCGYLIQGERRPNSALGLTFLYQHLQARAWRGGSCLVLEDAEHAEAEGDGLAIAEALLDGAVGNMPILVLATLNGDALARDPALRRRVEDLQEAGATRIGVPRLSVDQTRQLMAESLLLEPELAESLAKLLEGAPLLAGILLREWAARGVLVPGPRTYFELAPGLELADVFPANVEELYHRRLDSAVASCTDPKAAEHAMASMAIAGEAPPTSIIRTVNATGLDALLATGLVKEEGGLLRFEDGALARTARRLALGLPQAPKIHEQLASAWQKLGERTGMAVDLPLGLHRLRAGKPSEAIAPLTRAVHSMLNQGRARAAARAADLAIEAADTAHAGGSRGSAEHRQEVRRLKALALLEADLPEAAEALTREALEFSGGLPLGEARLSSVLAQACLAQGDAKQAKILLEEARRVFHRFQDTDGLADVAYTQALLATQRNDAVVAERSYKEVISIRPPEHRQAVLAVGGLASLFLLTGRMDEAQKLIEDLTWAARASGDTRNMAQAHYSTGMLLLEKRELDEARECFQTARGIAATSGDYRMQLNCLNNLGEVCRFQMKSAEAQEIYTRYTRLARLRGYEVLQAVGHVNLALLDMTAGRINESDRHAIAAGEALVTQPHHWVWVYVGLVRSACASGRGERRAAIQWWNLATERGLSDLRSADLWIPLMKLNKESHSRGWTDLERNARSALLLIKQA
jgi:tetratricopeptide (TPR) repeat protein